MTRTMIGLILGTCFAAAALQPTSAQAPTPVYIVLGDSIEFGLSDDIAADGIGYPPIFKVFLETFLQAPVDLHNFSSVAARTLDIWREQLRPGLDAAAGHAPVVVSWGGGGNDLGDVATGPQAAACRRSESCLARFNAVLNQSEQTIDRTVRELRQVLGPSAVILMRTQYNALLRPGCATAEIANLGSATLEGLPGTILDRGLNDRIRAVAQLYGAQVVDVFFPFALNAGALVSPDCIHPSGAGYQAIAAMSWAAFLAAH
jgi:lysophospholipase L1-like esterase